MLIGKTERRKAGEPRSWEPHGSRDVPSWEANTMLTTSAEARNRVCLVDMVGPDCVMGAGHCRGEECSAWHWEAVAQGAAAGARLGYCGVIGCVERRVRKHPRRLVEATVTLS